jgi:hypothetical protein
MKKGTEIEGNRNSSPVYLQGDVSVFLNTRNIRKGPNAGTSFDVFTYIRGTAETGGQWRCDVPAQIEGYLLQNTNGGSDVVDLIDGKQVLARVIGKGEPYAILIAGTGLHETNVENQVYRRLDVVSALAYCNETNRVESFMIRSREPDGSESKFRNLKCYSAILAEGTGEKHKTRPVWVRITVADAITARDAVAKGKPYFVTRDDGVRLELVGMESVEKSKTPQILMKFRAFAGTRQQQQNASPEDDATPLNAAAADSQVVGAPTRSRR